MTASIDMLQEIGRNDKQVFQVKGVSYIEPRPGLDLAFLEVEQIDGRVAMPITLSARAPTKIRSSRPSGTRLSTAESPSRI